MINYLYSSSLGQNSAQPSTAEPDIEDLKENIQQLRQKIEEQSQELQRLQDSKP